MLNQRYPGRLELRAPQGATPTTLRMQAQTAARYEDILAHVTLTGTGGPGQPSGPPMGPDQSVGPGGLATPGTGGCLRAPPQQSDALLAFRADGGVVWSTDGAPLAHPVSCLLWLLRL